MRLDAMAHSTFLRACLILFDEYVAIPSGLGIANYSHSPWHARENREIIVDVANSSERRAPHIGENMKAEEGLKIVWDTS